VALFFKKGAFLNAPGAVLKGAMSEQKRERKRELTANGG
jgi:hypothetical protein